MNEPTIKIPVAKLSPEKLQELARITTSVAKELTYDNGVVLGGVAADLNALASELEAQRVETAQVHNKVLHHMSEDLSIAGKQIVALHIELYDAKRLDAYDLFNVFEDRNIQGLLGCDVGEIFGEWAEDNDPNTRNDDEYIDRIREVVGLPLRVSEEGDQA